MLVGVLVCTPMLALYQFGAFNRAFTRVSEVLPRFMILPEEGLQVSLPLQYSYYTLMAFVSAWVCIEMYSQSRKFAFLVGAAFMTATMTLVLAANGILFEPFSGTFASSIAGLAGIALSGTMTGYRRHMLHRFFVGRLATKSFEELAQQNNPKKLTERRQITVLTARLANHIDLASHLPAGDFEAFTTYFEERAAEFLVTRGGYLETCNAQRVRILFGYPLENENHALHACQVALQFRDYLVELQKEMHTRWNWKPRFGISVSSGTLACGLFGYSEFQVFSAVGDAVEFGDRLCALNAVYGSHILLAAATYELVRESMEVRPMEMVFSPRQKQATEVFELLGAHGDLNDSETRARVQFAEGILSLREGDYQQARESFDKSRIEGRDDPPLRYFIERLDAELKKKDPEESGVPKHARSLAMV